MEPEECGGLAAAAMRKRSATRLQAAAPVEEGAARSPPPMIRKRAGGRDGGEGERAAGMRWRKREVRPCTCKQSLTARYGPIRWPTSQRRAVCGYCQYAACAALTRDAREGEGEGGEENDTGGVGEGIGERRGARQRIAARQLLAGQPRKRQAGPAQSAGGKRRDSWANS